MPSIKGVSKPTRTLFSSGIGEIYISQTSVLSAICHQIGLDAGEFFTACDDPEIKARLRANTDEVIARGGFGSPTIFVDGDDMYFGNDRIPLIEAALAR